MTIYVDPLFSWGMKYRGNAVRSCHMATDGNLEELHQMARKLGLRKYFQDRPGLPHYDLMVGKRQQAIRLGAVEVTAKELLELCKTKPNQPK